MMTHASPRMVPPTRLSVAERHLSRPEMRPSFLRGGFTLVEVILVVTVLAIIVSLLIPVISKARERANTATCLNNLRTLYVAMMSYQNDHNGWFPPGKKVYYDEDVADTYGEAEKGSIKWSTHLIPDYIGAKRNFFCPAMEIMEEFRDRYPDRRKRLSERIGYGINMWLLQNKMSSMPGPDWDNRYPYPGNHKLLFLADTTGAGIMWAATHYDLAMDGYTPGSVALKPRSHSFPDALNFMFLDGHAATLRRGTAHRSDSASWNDVFEQHGRNGLYIPARGKREAEAQ